MTNEEIFEKAIKKAVDNGFKRNAFYSFAGMKAQGSEYTNKDFAKELAFRYETQRKEIIFNHDFAKAFWGSEAVCKNCHYNKVWDCSYHHKDEGAKCPFNVQHLWQWHLQQMILRPEPLKYLEKFLD